MPRGLLGFLLGSLFLGLAGCSSTEVAPESKSTTAQKSPDRPPTPVDPDLAYARTIQDKEKLIQQLQERQQPTGKSTPNPENLERPPELPPLEKRQVIIDEIYAQLKKYQSLGVPVIRDERTDQLLPEIYFGYDESAIKPAFKEVLVNGFQFLLSELEKRGDLLLQIEGHADERGSPEYNLVLGHQRAHTVYQFLNVYAEDAEKLTKLISFGAEQPAVLGHSEDAWKFNRRVLFTIVLKETD